MEAGTQTCSWEEDIYWNNFQYTHFSCFLHSDFKTRLVIPTKFSKKMRTKFPATVNLRGPSGNSWSVGIASLNDETVFFSSGWKEFAQDHCLQGTDLLIFRYNGDSLFDVLVFDLESSCEKADSYFARKQEMRKKMRGDTTTATSAEFIAPSPPGQQNATKPTTLSPVTSESPNKRARTGSIKPATSRDWNEKSRRRALRLASYFTATKQGTGMEIEGSNGTTSTSTTGSGGLVGLRPPILHTDDVVDGCDRKGIPQPVEKSAEDGFDATPPFPTCPPVISELSSERARTELTEEWHQRGLKWENYPFARKQEMGRGSATDTTSASSEGFVSNDGNRKRSPPAPVKPAGDDGINRKPPPFPSCPPMISELSNKRARAELTKPPVVKNHDWEGWKSVTEESKLRAAKEARLALTEDGFISVMKITHVKRIFYMSVPIKWIKKHMDDRVKQDVILRVGEKEWRVKYRLRQKRDSGGLTNGWRMFAEDNNLQPYDVCLFQPSKSSRCYVPGADGSDIVLDVKIFRCST
ncbi:B3 domain-containing protein REM16 [Linum perenne]